MASNQVKTFRSQLEVEARSFDSTLTYYLEHYPYPASQLYEAATYSVAPPAHRWRPILFVRVYNKFARETSETDVFAIACAIEFLHTASIILDDLPCMDDGKIRRGRVACHLVFGESRAIAAALWLCDVAQHLLHNAAKDVDLENLFRETKTEMMKGQVLDLEGKNLPKDEIIAKYRMKSGALYAFTASAPALMHNNADAANTLSAFGNYLGIAYQISDDIHDQVDSVATLSKDVHKDVDKDTIPGLLGLKKAAQMRDAYRLEATNKLSALPLVFEDLIQLAEEICR
ncbi:MAG TPA: polyprenyl synthetase family protein [Pyrinomonadaceae bacterium]|nr:polyprenyl synthetase family protein [Pyrinomonadaceae bacterium]